MKKGLLFISLFAGIVMLHLLGSCSRTDNQVRLGYVIDSVNPNVYVGDTGVTHWFLKALFVSGNPMENVTIKFAGLPARMVVSPDSFTQVPTFIQDFQFRGNYATLGSYPASVIVYSPSTGTKTINFNLVVVHSNCGMGIAGNYNASSGCATANYTYTATVSHLANDTVIINNLGGYGTNTNTKVALNCGTDSLYIASQNIGNGVTVSGKGTFSSNQLSIYYTATNTPGGYNDVCSTVMTKN
jgi:hypothetical protein